MRWWGRFGQFALAAFLAFLALIGLAWVVYWYAPMPAMFSHTLAVAARTAFRAGIDPIEIRRSYCATRSRQVTVYVELYNPTTGRRIVEARPRERLIAKGCYENEVIPILLPPGITQLDPGDYVIKTWALIHPAHPYERPVVETSPDIPFTVVWRK